MIRDFLSLPFQSPVIVSQSDGWGLTSWMLKHRGRGWPSFPRKNRCGGLCGISLQAPRAIDASSPLVDFHTGGDGEQPLHILSARSLFTSV